jgi:hypothetical protein
MKTGSSKAVEILPRNLSLRLIELWVVLQVNAPLRVSLLTVFGTCDPTDPTFTLNVPRLPNPLPAQRLSNPSTVPGLSKLSVWL